ncbi:hypothetical protein GQ457_06G012990 [Hibiscus cannabinus]
MSTQIPASFSLQPVSFVPVYRPASQVYTNDTHPSSVSPHAFMITLETPTTFVATPEMVDDNAWYPDSGATHHLTKDASNLQPTTTFQGSGNVQVRNGHLLPINSSGQSVFFTKSKQFQLKNLLFVPGITKNLLSVSKFTQDNQVSVEFFPRCCQVKDLQSKEVLLQGQEINGLYCLGVSPTCGKFVSNSASCNVAINNFVSTEVWHKRLGHPSYSVLIKALSGCKISASDNKNSSDFSVCSACQYGKSHKLPFTSSHSIYSTT